LLGYFAETSLVDQFAYGFQIGIAPSDIWFSNSQHVNCGLVQTYEHTVVDLSQTEQFQAFSYFWMNTIHTRINIRNIRNKMGKYEEELNYVPSGTDDKGQFGLSGHVKVFGFASYTSQTNQILFFFLVFADVFFGALKYFGSFLLLLFSAQNESTGTGGSGFGILLTLFE
jgi:hypothetical protein